MTEMSVWDHLYNKSNRAWEMFDVREGLNCLLSGCLKNKTRNWAVHSPLYNLLLMAAWRISRVIKLINWLVSHKNINSNYSDNWFITTVIFQAEISDISRFQLLKCEDMLLFLLSYLTVNEESGAHFTCHSCERPLLECVCVCVCCFRLLSGRTCCVLWVCLSTSHWTPLTGSRPDAPIAALRWASCLTTAVTPSPPVSLFLFVAASHNESASLS